jgi:hypothetical protein
VDAHERKRFLRGFCLLAALAAVFSVWVDAGLGGETAVVYMDDLATAGAALAAAFLCARAARRHSGRLRRFWWLLAAACGAWTLGEAIWAVYDLALGGDVPAASFADAAYLTAMVLAGAALLVHPALRGRAIAKSRSLVDGLVLAAALFFLGWTLVFEPVRQTADLASLGGLVTLAYPLGDIVLIFLIVLVIRGATNGVRLELWCLLAGLLALSLSDAVYSYLTNVTSYSSGSAIDVGWFAGYLGLALAALCSRPAPAAEPRAEAAPSLTTAALVAPFLPMLGALTLVSIKLGLGHRLDGVTLTVAFVLIVLVLVRQLLVVVDLLAPGRETEDNVPVRLLAAIGGAEADRPAEPAAIPRLAP